ncbi:MAG: TPM domain-containing protein [Burkholderiaceae bacterium]|nr:TPM domain-containing protein [Burkholderiaceae bacterium]
MPHHGNRLLRLWRHLTTDHADFRRMVGAAALDAIEAAVHQGERAHTAELRVAFEPALPLASVLRRTPPRHRALEVFGSLRVWDTEGNNGVLIYVLLADHAVEIIADRSAARAIPQSQWDDIARSMSAAFARGAYREGTSEAVIRLNALLAAAFPSDGSDNPDELPNRPAVL